MPKKKVESSYDPSAVNLRGKAHHFNTKEDAERFVQAALRKGCRNVSLGCAQLLYTAHKGHFGNSVKNMLTPDKNIAYAAKLLMDLRNRYKTWETAIGKYHSNNERRSINYCRKITKVWKHTV
jgi:soluble lytic murein transglycosylase-like protein